MEYINYNGNIFHRHETLLPVTNRGFRYGDAFFETMVMFNSKIPLLEFHWTRLEFSASVLSATLPSKFNAEKLHSLILDLAAVNDLVANARVRVQFFRAGEGLYLPEDDKLGYVITMDKIENTKFELGEGLKAGIRDDCFKPVSMTSDLKTSNALLYILCSQFAKSEGWDELIMLNADAMVCEAIHSNVFLYKEGKFVTPNLESGCVNGVMRSYLIALQQGLVEEREVHIHELLDADEIILTNAVKGIQWIKEYGGKTYSDTKALELTHLINLSLPGLEA
jgi:branched-subunit amino acid aminotransferase/4-amino-4-deoxychorismate lyase